MAFVDLSAPDESGFVDLSEPLAPPKPVEGGLINAAKQVVGSTIKGAGQVASDYVPGVSPDNAVTRYGQSVVDANPTAIHSLEDIAARPVTALKEATGNAAGSIAGMVGARVAGQAITAASPLAGPAAPVVAAAGQLVAWLGPVAIASLPSYGSIRDKQLINNPEGQEEWKEKAKAAVGAAAVGAIETKFGPQNWALAALTKEGRAELAQKFASTTLTGAMVKTGLKGAAIEGSEELVQNPIEQLAAGDDPRTPESVKETLFGGAMGALGGKVLGATAGAVQHATASPKVKPAADILDAPDVDTAIAAFKFEVSGEKSDLTELRRTYKDHTPEDTASHQAELLKALETDPSFAADAEGKPTAYGAPLRALAPQELPTEGEGLTRDAYEAIAAINVASGLKTVVYQDHANLPDGLVKQPDVVFISSRTSIDPAVVAAHEAQHLSEEGEPQSAYAKIVQEELTEKAVALAIERHGKLSDAKIQSEIRADLTGDAWADPTFHGRVITKMREQLGEKAAETNALSFLDSIKNLIVRIKQTLTGTTFTSPDGQRLATQYVKNLERVHDALAAAIADNFIQKGYRPPGAQTNTSQILVARAIEQQAARVAAEAVPAFQRTAEQKIRAEAGPIVPPLGASPELVSALAAAAKAPFDRTTEERLNLEAIRIGVRMSPKPSKIRTKDGEPLVVYRGAKNPLSDRSFASERLGGATGHTSSGLGVFFTPSKSEAAKYGNVESFTLDIRNPMVIKAEDVPSFESVQEAVAYREALKQQGHDGIVISGKHLGGSVNIVAFSPEQVKRPAEVQKSPKSERAKIEAARTGVVVNIGLNVGDKKSISETQARAALKLAGVKVLSASVQQSDTEATLVAVLDRALTPAEANAVAVNLKQESIAQLVKGEGELYGPGADKWRPFNPEFFLTPDGKRLSEAEPAPRKAVRRSRTVRELMKHLTLGEQRRITDRAAALIVEKLKTLPKSEEFAAIAFAGRAKRGWYARSAQTISDIFGPDGPRFAALLAALSPQTGVESNLRNALNVWRGWVEAGRPEGRNAILDIMADNVEGGGGPNDSVLGAWKNNSVRALTDDDPRGLDLSGPKVNSFFLNLIGYVMEVTNDTWMANYAGVEQTLFAGQKDKTGVGRKSLGYIAFNARVREAAAKLTELTGETWTPAEVQETIWSWAKSVYEYANRAGEKRNARQVVTDQAVTHDMIASTPSFDTMFLVPEFRDILERAGYGEELEQLGSAQQDHARQVERIARVASQASPFGGDAQQRHEARAARRLDELADRERAADAALQRSPKQQGGGRGGRSLAEAQATAARAADGEVALKGAPTAPMQIAGDWYVPGPVAIARRAAKAYGGAQVTEYAKLDKSRAARIAQAFHEMPHEPERPEVKAAYRAMIDETLAQWRAIKATGLRVEFIKGEDPYAVTPRQAIQDVVDNNHLWVFPTDSGFGSDATDVSGNPLLELTDEVIDGYRLRANDVFRIVHDYFGHIKDGNGFRAEGEENAWRSHAAMYSPLARRAMTVETRGQNSWVNFGPHAEANRTASAADTVYAPQKTGLMPEWVSEEGAQFSPKQDGERYVIVDRQTGKQVGDSYAHRGRARTRADKLDLEYGAVRYQVKPAPAPTLTTDMADQAAWLLARARDEGYATVDALPAERFTELAAEWRAAHPRERDGVLQFSPKNVDKISETFRTSLRDHFAQKSVGPVKLSDNTPATLQLFGWIDRPIVIEPTVLDKMLFDHGLTVPQIANLPYLLQRPMMIFANQDRGTLNFVGPQLRDGPPVLIAIKPGATEPDSNMVVTSFEPERGWDEVTKRLMRGELVYRDTTKVLPKAVREVLERVQKNNLPVPSALPHDLHRGTTPNASPGALAARAGQPGATRQSSTASVERPARILFQSDVVKWEISNWGEQVLFSPKVKDDTVYWHGSPSGDLRGGRTGLHLGSKLAATQALEARIGVPASGSWDGTREYGKTLLAGKKTLERLRKERGYYLDTGFNVDAPDEDYYPTGKANYGDGTPVPLTAKPSVKSFRLNTEMTNTRGTPHEDFKANGYMAAALKRGGARRGFYYKNVGEGDESDPISVVVPSAAHLEKVDDIQRSPKIVGDSKRPYTPEQRRMFQNVGRSVEVPTLRNRIANMRKDLGKKMAQGLVDQFAPLKELSPMAYMLARLSKGAAGALEALLHHGKLRLNAGAFDADRSGGFIERVGIPLQGELEDFLWWVAANRAERLSAQDRERLFSKSDIAAGKSLASGLTSFDYVDRNGTKTRDRKLIYADSLKKFDEFNKNALDMAEQSGLIDSQARQIWEHEFYVPFYRVSEEDGSFIGGNIGNALVRQRAFKRLRGGEQKLNSDLLANTIANWAHLIDASAKNRAAKASLEAAAQMGVAIEAPAATIASMGKSIGKNGVWFMDAGVKRHFLVDDPFVLTAITSLEYSGMKGPVMDAMSAFKHILTVGVTASPAFKIRNLIRDSLQAIAVAPIGANPLANAAQGFAAVNTAGTLKNFGKSLVGMRTDTLDMSQTYVSALASGGLIRFGTMLEGRMSDRVRQLIKSGVKETSILNSDSKLQALYDRLIEPAVAAYNELGNRSEEITRAALYTQLTAKGMDHATASLMARDLMDFSLQGSWTGIRFLTQVVPFMNARMQGLYKLGRGAVEDPRRFAAVLAATAMFSVALLAAYSDDDDWKKREDWDRDNFWWFKIGGMAFRIPKPFEVGAIATLAERGLEYFISQEMTGERFRKVVLSLVGSNLSMNPVPQLFKPIVDMYANKDSFSGRPIETMGMERLQPDYRFNARTSLLARAAGTAGQAVTSLVGVDFVSPVKIDHALRGYFGWLGSFVVGAADLIARPLTNEAERPAGDPWKFATQGFITELPTDQSRYVSHMYEQARSIEQAYGTYRALLKQGKGAEAKEFLEDNRGKIAKYQGVQRVKRAEAQLNERIRIIERSALDPEAKRVAIAAIALQKDRVARLVK